MEKEVVFVEKLKKLVELGKSKQNALDASEINDFFIGDNLNPEQRDQIYNYLENNNMLVSGEFTDKPEFESYTKYVIPEDEAYAANSIWVNDTVIIPEGYPAVLAAVKAMGYRTITVDTSEYRKLDGGLSCLSLRF